MQKLPEKQSKNWIYILLGQFIIIFIALIIQSKILDYNMNTENIIGFAILALSISLLITIGGYLGGRIYFITSSIFNISGLIYMITITLNKTAEDWNDLVSLVSYLTLLVIGFGIGLIAQLIYTIIAKKKGLS